MSRGMARAATAKSLARMIQLYATGVIPMVSSASQTPQPRPPPFPPHADSAWLRSHPFVRDHPPIQARASSACLRVTPFTIDRPMTRLHRPVQPPIPQPTASPPDRLPPQSGRKRLSLPRRPPRYSLPVLPFLSRSSSPLALPASRPLQL